MSEPTKEEDEYIWVKRVPVVEEAMIERAAKVISDWRQMGNVPRYAPNDKDRRIAEEVLRAALEVSNE